jgi:Xaa-Pro dipeptidase
VDIPLPYRRRIERAQAALAEHRLDAFLDLTAVNVAYLTGFFYNQTERPAGILLPRSGEPILLLPLLDIDQARAESWVSQVETYFEFPGRPHPVVWMGERLRALGFDRATIGLDEGTCDM